MVTEAAPLDVTQPFSRADALEAGIPPSTLRTQAYRRLFRGVYVVSSVRVTPDIRVRAALTLLHPSSFASHTSAARTYGVPVPVDPDEHVSVSEPGHRRPRPGIRCHLCREPDVRTIAGVRVSAPAQLFVELSTLLNLVDLVVAGDHLVRRGLVTVDELRARCRATPPGSLARRAVALVRERVDSPMETRLRLLLVLAGLPEPEVNLTLRDVDGVPLRRFDLSYPAIRLIVEYDGRHHAERIETWESDLDRREEIDDTGWRILVVTSRGIYADPGRTIERVWRLLRASGLPGVPARPSEDWRPHFPGHSSTGAGF